MSERDSDRRVVDAQNRSADLFAGKLVKIAGQAKATRSTGFKIPELEDDPSADEQTNAWLFADGQLNTRTLDGELHRYPEYADPPDDRPPVPTFTSDPAESTGWKLWFNSGTGELRGRLANGNVVTYAPAAPDSSTDGGTPPPATPPPTSSTKPKPADPVIRKFRKVYHTTSVRVFCTKHGIEGGSEPYIGLYPGAHGERRAMFHFDDSQIRSDLAGATIRRVELQMRVTYSYYFKGIDVDFGSHNRSSSTSSFSQNRRSVWKNNWPHSGWGGGDNRWRNTLTWFGRALRDNSIKGLTIDQPGGVTHYGRIDRDSLSLAITYTKAV